MSIECDGCPIKEKIALYKKVATNPQQATDLANEQEINRNYPPEQLMQHYNRSAEQLLYGCKTKILCEKYAK